MKKSLAALSATVFALVSAVACGSDAPGTGPGGGGGGGGETVTLAPGDTRSGVVRDSTTVVTYRIDVPERVEFRVHLETRGRPGDTLVARTGLVQGGNTTPVVAGHGNALDDTYTPWMTRTAGQQVKVEVRGLRNDDQGSFTVRLFTRSRRPESAGDTLLPGTAVVESMTPEDMDQFVIKGDGRTYVVFVRGTGGPATDSIHVTVAPQFGFNVDSVVVPTATADLRHHGTVRFPTWAGKLHGVTVRMGSGKSAGSYELLLYPVAPATETAPAALAVGVPSAEEAIGHPGDVDEFTFPGRAGQQVSLLTETREGLGAGHTVELLLGTGESETGQTSGPGVPGRFDRGVPRYTLPYDMTYRVRVYGVASAGTAAVAQGAYRLLVHPVDTRPETASATYALGTSLTAEEIDVPGDVDEFTLAIPRDTMVMLSLSRPSASPPGLRARLLNAAGEVLDGTWYGEEPWDVGVPFGYGNGVRLAAGTYRLRVEGATPTSLGMGAYTLRTYAVDERPETRAAAAPVDAWAGGEAIDYAGDVDRFTFSLPAGREFNLHARGEAGLVGTIVARLESPSGRIIFHPSKPMGTGRIRAEAGTYTLVVYGPPLPDGRRTVGPYSFQVDVIDRAPEGLSATYTVGDTIRSAIEAPGDIDEFTFTATAGTRLRLDFAGSGLQSAHVQNAQDESVHWSGGPTGPEFVTPYTGTYLLRVYDFGLDQAGLPDANRDDTGPYTVSITRP